MAYMTPQEFQMQQEMLRQGRVPQQTPISTPGMSAGMAPGTSAAMPDFAAAAQTFGGETERIAQQRLMAQQMTEQSFKSPELIRAGNVSVAGANPMTALAQALRAGTGAYGNMEAGKASKALAEKEAKRDTALGEVATYTAEQELLAATRAQENADRTAVETNRSNLAGEFATGVRNTETNRSNLAGEFAADRTATETASNNAIAQTLAQDKQNDLNKQRDTVSFHDPSDPSRVLNLKRDAESNYFTIAGDLVPGAEVDALTPYRASDSGSVGKLSAAVMKMQAEAAADADPNNGLPGDAVARILTSDLDQATGMFDPERWLGSVGLGKGGPETQDVQREMGSVMLEGMADTLKRVKLTPISDSEGVILRANIPSANTQPYGWTGWAVNDYRRVYDNKFDKAIADGTHTLADKAAVMNPLDAAIAYQAVRSNYPVSKLEEMGVDLGVYAKAKAAYQAKQAASKAEPQAGAARTVEDIDAEQESIYQQYPSLRPK